MGGFSLLRVLQSLHTTTVVEVVGRIKVLQFLARTNVVDLRRLYCLQLVATTSTQNATAPPILSAKFVSSEQLAKDGIIDFSTVTIKVQGIPPTDSVTTGFHITKQRGHPTKSYADIEYMVNIDKNGVGFFTDKLQNPTPWTTYIIKQALNNVYSLPSEITFTTKIEI